MISSNLTVNPKVSIIIPVYNAQRFLKETLESALNQTYQNKEIIVMDDGSTDESLQIANTFNGTDCKVFTQKNMGGCAARNKAFEYSTGDYIQYLDADDLLSPNKIEMQMQLLNNSEAGTVASCSWLHFTHEEDLVKNNIKRRPIDKDYNNPIEWLIDAWEGKGMSLISCWLTPRQLIEKAGKWDERLLINQDGEFFCRVLLRAKQIQYTPKAKVFYRVGNSLSITGKITVEKCRSQLFSYKLYENHVLKVEDSKRVKHALMHNYLSFIYHHYNTYPELMPEAKSEIKKLGFNKLKAHGGRNFRFFAHVIGFECALKLRLFFDRKKK